MRLKEQGVNVPTIPGVAQLAKGDARKLNVVSSTPAGATNITTGSKSPRFDPSVAQASARLAFEDPEKQQVIQESLDNAKDAEFTRSALIVLVIANVVLLASNLLKATVAPLLPRHLETTLRVKNTVWVGVIYG